MLPLTNAECNIIVSYVSDNVNARRAKEASTKSALFVREPKSIRAYHVRK